MHLDLGAITLRARDAGQRDGAMVALRVQGKPSVIYYPKSLHRQTAYRDFQTDPNELPHSEAALQSVFSLPMSPYLRTEDQVRVIEILQGLKK